MEGGIPGTNGKKQRGKEYHDKLCAAMRERAHRARLHDVIAGVGPCEREHADKPAVYDEAEEYEV